MEAEMADSTETKTKTETDPFFHRPLKTLDVGQIETAIADALGALVDADYEADVHNLDFKPEPHAFMNDAVEIRVTVKKRSNLDWGSTESDASGG